MTYDPTAPVFSMDRFMEAWRLKERAPASLTDDDIRALASCSPEEGEAGRRARAAALADAAAAKAPAPPPATYVTLKQFTRLDKELDGVTNAIADAIRDLRVRVKAVEARTGAEPSALAWSNLDAVAQLVRDLERRVADLEQRGPA